MKRWFVFSGLLLLAAIAIGCGQAQQAATPTVTASNVTFTGTAAASSSDLAKMGVSSLAVETQAERAQRINTLKAMGFDEGSINALNLKPLSAAGTTVYLYKLSTTSATSTLVDSEPINSNGSFNLTDEAYNSNNSYYITTTLTKSAISKDLTMNYLIDSKPGTGSTTATLSSLNPTPQTTLVMQIIEDKIVEALGTGAIDADTYALIKTLVVNKINYLISTEGMSLTTVKEITASENTSLKNAALQSFMDTAIQKAIQAIKFKAGFVKGATDQATARKIMKEIFTFITGSSTGIPENIVNAFADSYVSGETRSIAQLATAADKCVSRNNVPVTGIFTTANVVTAFQNLISGTYQTASVTAQGPQYEIKSQNPVIQAAFPASEWVGKTIDGNTTLNVPQLILSMGVGEQIAASAVPPAQFNAPKVAMELGLLSGIGNTYQIMHSEIRIESFEDWQNFNPGGDPNARPAVEAVLSSFVNAGNMGDPTAVNTGLTATLTYTKTNGTTATVNYKRETGNFGPKSVKSFGMPKAQSVTAQQMGPPPGFVMFSIQPWGNTTEAQKITDFQRGSNAVIKILNNGTQVDSKTIPITAADLSSATINFKTPYPNVYDPNSAFITVFQTGQKALMEWSFATGSFSKLTPAYAVEVRYTQQQPGPGGYTYYGSDFSRPAIYSSWNKQDFIEAKQNESSTLTLTNTATLPADVYAIQGAVVGLDSNGWPVVSGPWRNTLFKFSATAAQAKTDVLISGEVTPPSTLTSGTTIKVGLFKMNWNMNFMTDTFTPVYVSTPVSNIYSMTLKFTNLETNGYGGYDTIAWEDNNTTGTVGKLDGASGERPFFPSKHLEYHSGILNAMDQNFNPLGPVTATDNTSGYNVNMSQQMW